MTSQFDRDSTAAEVASAYSFLIKDKVVLTTGVSPGSLGSAFVQTIAEHSPALLILAGRNQGKLDQTKADILSKTPNAKLRTLTLDLSTLSKVSEAATEVKSYGETIDVLVNNGAIMAQPYSTTVDGIESQFGTNHVGHFLFTNLLLPKILKRGKALRIVNVSSDGHRYGGIRWGDYNFKDGEEYNKWMAYGQAKTANILFSVALAEKYGGQGVKAYSLHPGVIKTNLGKHLKDYEVVFKELQELNEMLGNPQMHQDDNSMFKTLQQGTSTHVLAAFAPDLPNGSYLLDTRVAKPEEVLSNAYDREDANRLWSESEKLIKEFL